MIPPRPPARRARSAAVRPPAVRAPRRSPSTATRWTTHLDDFHPQGSTQWDALGHVRCREHGFWGGRTQDPTEGPNGLGIDHWARHGIAGRGVLIDLAGWVAVHRSRLRPARRRWPSPPTTSARCSPPQGVEPEVGDIWCVRTGWYQALPRGSTRAARAAYADRAALRRPARRRGDGPARLERPPGRPVLRQPGRRGRAGRSRRSGRCTGASCRRSAPRSARCSTSTTWPPPAGPTAAGTFFFVAAPLNLPDGIGSPGNAVAIR